jgi:hypothetical protein
MTQTPSKCQALTCMPAIDNAKAELFIKSVEGQAISWSTFSNPFYIDMWLMILAVAVLIASILTLIEKSYGGQPIRISNFYNKFFVYLLFEICYKVNISIEVKIHHKMPIHRPNYS